MNILNLISNNNSITNNKFNPITKLILKSNKPANRNFSITSSKLTENEMQKPQTAIQDIAKKQDKDNISWFNDLFFGAFKSMWNRSTNELNQESQSLHFKQQSLSKERANISTAIQNEVAKCGEESKFVTSFWDRFTNLFRESKSKELSSIAKSKGEQSVEYQKGLFEVKKLHSEKDKGYIAAGLNDTSATEHTKQNLKVMAVVENKVSNDEASLTKEIVDQEQKWNGLDKWIAAGPSDRRSGEEPRSDSDTSSIASQPSDSASNRSSSVERPCSTFGTFTEPVARPNTPTETSPSPSPSEKRSLVDDFANPMLEMPSYFDPED